MESGKIIVVANQKGGVAKTSTVRNLSYALAEMGKKVLVVDFDPQYNLTTSFGVLPTQAPYNTGTLITNLLLDESLPDTNEFIQKIGSVDLIPSSRSLTVAEANLLMTPDSNDYLAMRLMIVAQGVRDSVQSAIVDVATENWDEAYAGLREGYSGGYQLAGSSWSQNVTSGNVYARLQDVLGIEYEGGQYVKYSGENLEYRLYDLHLDVENAPLAPSVPDGITQLNVTGTITVDVPLSFGFGHLPPMQITMKLNAKYVPRF